MKIRRCFLTIVVLSALAPGTGWGASTDADSVDSGKPGAQHRNDQGDQPDPTAPPQHKGVAHPKPAQKGASMPSRKVRDRTVGSKPRGATKALGTAAMTPSQRLAAVPRFGPNAVSPGTLAAVSGNAVARHTSIKAGVGGPTRSDAKHGSLVVVGGTASQGRHSRSGGYQ